MGKRGEGRPRASTPHRHHVKADDRRVERWLFRVSDAERRGQARKIPSMGRLDRLLQIIHAVTVESGLNPDALARRFGVSRRRIFEDIGTICRAGIRIGFGPDGYRLLARPGPVLPIPLREEEVAALALSAATTDPDAAARARRKVASAAPRELRDLILQGRLSSEAPSSGGDGDILKALHEAIADARVARIEYASASSAHGAREVHPHGVFFRGTGWYVVAYEARRRSFRHFRVDRIRRVEVLGEGFARQGGFDLKGHLEKFIGAWHGGWLGARIRVEGWAVPYIESEARARKLKFRRTDGGAAGLLEIERGHPDEAAWLVLQFAGGLRVLAPESLRKRVAELARAALALHEDGAGAGEGMGSPRKRSRTSAVAASVSFQGREKPSDGPERTLNHR